jgi:hypothetical protein
MHPVVECAALWYRTCMVPNTGSLDCRSAGALGQKLTRLTLVAELSYEAPAEPLEVPKRWLPGGAWWFYAYCFLRGCVQTPSSGWWLLMIVAEVQPEQTGWIWWNPTKISLLLWHAKIRQQDLKRHHAAQVWKQESPVTAGDRSQLGSVVGGLAWVARQARPDLSYKVPKLQSWCNNANYQRLSKATSGPWTGIQISCSRLEEHDACHGIWRIMEQWDRIPQGKQQKHRGQRARITILASPDLISVKTKRQVSTYI